MNKEIYSADEHERLSFSKEEPVGIIPFQVLQLESLVSQHKCTTPFRGP